MTTCDRCGCETNVTVMSKFNRDTLCPECKRDERMAPNYERADRAECDAVKAGNYNFPGIGLAPEDIEFLRPLRNSRACEAFLRSLRQAAGSSK